MKPIRYLIIFPLCDHWRTSENLDRVGQKVDLLQHNHRLFTAYTNQEDCLFNDEGVFIIGKLFHRYGPARRLSSKRLPHEVDNLPVSRSDLLKKYWGEYLAIMPDGLETVVQPDPMGNLPCYFHETGELIAFASEPDLLVDAGLLQLSMNWMALAQHLVFDELPLKETPIDGLFRVLPGSAVSVRCGQARMISVWSPWSIVSRSSGIAGDYVDDLHRVIGNCVGALSRTYENSMYCVSGGLDSSIVAAAATRSIGPIDAVTVATDDMVGDERHFARILCRHLDCRLIEETYRIEDIDLDRSCASHRPFPSGRTPSLAYNAALVRAVEKSGAQSVFMGVGGDNIFFLHKSTRPLIDRWKEEGLGYGLAQTFSAIRHITQCSSYAAAGQALRYAVRPPRRFLWRPQKLYMAKEVLSQVLASPPNHEWLEPPSDGLPGKSAHIAMILRIQNYLDMLDRSEGIAVVNPLMSQPIVEKCLAIASWKWLEGGLDRAVARQAWEQQLPAEIISRTQKGGPDGFAGKVLEKMREGIRVRLLGGHMAAQGLLDTEALESHLDSAVGQRGFAFVHLLHLVDTEAWVARWLKRRP